MAILLPQQFWSLAAGVGASFYENLSGGTNATVTVNNTSANPVNLVIYRVNAPIVTYTVLPFNSLTLEVALLLVAALQPPAGAAFGTIQIATSDF